MNQRQVVPRQGGQTVTRPDKPKPDKVKSDKTDNTDKPKTEELSDEQADTPGTDSGQN